MPPSQADLSVKKPKKLLSVLGDYSPEMLVGLQKHNMWQQYFNGQQFHKDGFIRETKEEENFSSCMTPGNYLEGPPCPSQRFQLKKHFAKQY